MDSFTLPLRTRTCLILIMALSVSPDQYHCQVLVLPNRDSLRLEEVSVACHPTTRPETSCAVISQTQAYCFPLYTSLHFSKSTKLCVPRQLQRFGGHGLVFSTWSWQWRQVLRQIPRSLLQNVGGSQMFSINEHTNFAGGRCFAVRVLRPVRRPFTRFIPNDLIIILSIQFSTCY